MRRRRRLPLALVLGVLTGLAICMSANAQGQTTTVELTSQNSSGVSGTAMLADVGGKLRVEIRANGAGAGPQPAHIHEGNCAQLNPAPKFALTDVVNGVSNTDIDGSLQAVLSTPHAIHMHKSPDELPIYVACADVRMANVRMADQPVMLPTAGDAPASAGTPTVLAAVGLFLSIAGYALIHTARRARGSQR
jgi:hypothetical protein